MSFSQDGLERRVYKLNKDIVNAQKAFKLNDSRFELDKLKEKTNEKDFWTNQDTARDIQKRIAFLSEQINTWDGLARKARDAVDGIAMMGQDERLYEDIKKQIESIEKDYKKQEYSVFLSGENDYRNAYLSLYSGAGGLDASEWTGMLERMYIRYCEKNNWKVVILSESRAEGGGLKSADLQIEAPYAYGLLKGERGVHRLVRVSPFSSANLRHTSFALVDITPEIEALPESELKEEDLRIDLFRASGPGGQNVNKRETAVRITHMPTNISAMSSSERSQAANKEKAYQLLSSKVYISKIKERDNYIADIRGDTPSAEWGNQIRSYVLYPYQKVKDHRTEVETSDTESVLDGDIDIFIKSFIKKLS